MTDFGGRNDGRCEYSFFRRCKRPAEYLVTYGQFGGWTYHYCADHKQLVQSEYEDVRIVKSPR